MPFFRSSALPRFRTFLSFHILKEMGLIGKSQLKNGDQSPDTTHKKTYLIFVFSVKIETGLKAISTIIYLKLSYGEIAKRIHNFTTGGIAG
ncbi:MAG: hypothetical protein ABFR82_14660 [Nitrospirota bacterium]